MNAQKPCAGNNHQRLLPLGSPEPILWLKSNLKTTDISAVLHSHICTQHTCLVSMSNLDERYVLAHVHQPPLGQQERCRLDIHHHGNTLARSICGVRLLARGKLKREVRREAFSFISAGISCHCYQERKQVHADGLNRIKDFSPPTTEASCTQRPSSHTEEQHIYMVHTQITTATAYSCIHKSTRMWCVVDVCERKQM